MRKFLEVKIFILKSAVSISWRASVKDFNEFLIELW